MLRYPERLRGVDSRLASLVVTLGDQADIVVLEGLRDDERQAQLVAAGKSRVKRSKHQDGRAVDLGVTESTEGYLDAGASPPPPPSKYPWARGVSWEVGRYKALAQVLACIAASRGVPLRWGGTWTDDPNDKLAGFCDAVHWELAT